uniref:Exosome complex component CSL4 n=1 Tax=Oncorhynchus mykiss TaxID=8022 RepID=A0A8K9XVU6_ONCMY
MFVRNWDEKLLSDLAILMVFVRLLLYSTIGNVIDQQDSVYTKHVCLSTSVCLVMIVVVLSTLVESSDCKSLDICEKFKCFSPCVCIHLSLPAGDRLCSTEDCMPGTGVYLRHGYIYSSLAGYVLRKNEGEELPVISVVRETEAQLLPDVGAIVTCKVTCINPRFAKVHILYVGSTPLKDRFRGTIRKEDVRATEKDRVETYKSFRPGDIVLAKVISLGDVQSNYLLTTAENELGVVVAHSEAGAQMVPISWCEMQCPRTHAKEFRKVARVQPEYLQA